MIDCVCFPLFVPISVLIEQLHAADERPNLALVVLGADEALLRLNGVKVERRYLVGELHNGFSLAMLGVGLGRLYNEARGVGLGRWALEQAIAHAKIRESFGQPLIARQGLMFPLAESATELHAAHLMALNMAKLLDKGLRATKEVAMAKAFAVEAGRTAVDRAMQAYGAMGFTNELHLTDAYVALRKVGVADGSNEILRHIIVRELAAGDLDL